MHEVNDSIYANNNSTITNANLIKNKEVKKIKRKSFIWGFLAGVIASIIANVIFHYIEPILF